MDKSIDLQAAITQRDRLARYIFQEDGGALSGDYCRAELAAGRCQCRDLPCEMGMVIDICVPCIVELIGNAPPKSDGP